MRLLNTTTLRLTEFFSHKEHPYAILSHRWGPDGEEVTFEDIMKEDRTDVEKKPGWDKLVKTCEKAREWGYEWAWVDTCCINKTSSAELTEALNSMFMWYRDSGVCFTIMRDVKAGEDHHAKDSSFRKAEWFTRGWTLQELIAPKDVVFYVQTDSGWRQIGNKATLRETITEITNVDEDVLLRCELDKVSLAKKMSWASNRRTTKVEDRAYSLIGIFGVTMTPIYGEGESAFKRLQAEIARVSNDQSLFAWSYLPGRTYDGSLLAPSPDCFCYSADIVAADYEEFAGEFHFSDEAEDHEITNQGLRIRLPFVINHALENAIELIAMPWKNLQQQREMEAAVKTIKEGGSVAKLIQSVAKMNSVRVFLACKFTTGDQHFVSLPLKVISHGKFAREFVRGGIEDLHYESTSQIPFPSTQVETVYISPDSTPFVTPEGPFPLPREEKPKEPEPEQKPGLWGPPPKKKSAVEKLLEFQKTSGLPLLQGLTVDAKTGKINLDMKTKQNERKTMSFDRESIKK